VQYSRGCPFSCEFCDIIEIYGRVPRTKSNQQMLAEFDELYRLGWRGPLFIVDDNFIGNKKNVRLLLPDMIAWQKKHGYPFSLLTEASVNLADDEQLLTAMKDAGFRRVFLGIETPVEESLKEAQKPQNRGNLLESVRRIQSHGMEVMAGLFGRARFRWPWSACSTRCPIRNSGDGLSAKDVCSETTPRVTTPSRL
jgi:radical SAM superfamily enzyme YgiQ (UPF0313 family)